MNENICFQLTRFISNLMLLCANCEDWPRQWRWQRGDCDDGVLLTASQAEVPDVTIVANRSFELPLDSDARLIQHAGGDGSV